MAGRPVKRRTAKSYRAEIETLNRLRMAIQLDRGILPELRSQTIESIDRLIENLLQLLPDSQSKLPVAES